MRWAITLLFLLAASDLEAQRLINSYAFGTNSTLNNGLIAYWKLDEASGTRFDSAPTGSPQDLIDINTVTSVAGKIGDAAFFTSSNQELLSHADSAELSLWDEASTITAWVKATTLDVDQMIVAHWYTVGTQRSWRLWFNSSAGKYQFSVSADGTAEVFVTANAFGLPVTNAWHFIAASHDTNLNTITISVNGGAVSSTAHSTGIHDSTGQFMIGARETTGWWDGAIDEVGFWERPLTTAEIAALYNSGAGRTCCGF